MGWRESVPANNGVLNRVRQGMTEMQRTRHVGRRNHHHELLLGRKLLGALHAGLYSITPPTESYCRTQRPPTTLPKRPQRRSERKSQPWARTGLVESIQCGLPFFWPFGVLFTNTGSGAFAFFSVLAAFFSPPCAAPFFNPH